MVKLIFERRNGERFEVTATPGRSVMETAVEAGVDIEAACGGSLACATCHMWVLEGGDRLKVPEEDESDMLEIAENRVESSRLTCQIRVDPAMEGIVFREPDKT